MTAIAHSRVPALVAANLLGICAFTYFHPHIKHAQSPMFEWLYLASLPITAAAICFGIYAMFRKSARAQWAKGFLALAWLFALSNVVTSYVGRASIQSQQPPRAEIGPPSEIDELLKDAPPHQPLR